jgi:hypothetical protein
VKKILYVKSYLDISFIVEEFAHLRIIFIARFSGDDLEKEENQNICYIARGNSMAGIYDDSKRNNLLNSNKKIVRAGTEINYYIRFKEFEAL